ncbi:hypothetical protein GGR50DRAFT_698917 [Xylaria sp. CBS 124048]|nr:hypothetical protein GGR50DRAFT_698917 [Xylaria sp. CBS 124048]
MEDYRAQREVLDIFSTAIDTIVSKTQGLTHPSAILNPQTLKQPVAPTNAKSYANAAAGHTTSTAITKVLGVGKNKKAGPLVSA